MNQNQYPVWENASQAVPQPGIAQSVQQQGIEQQIQQQRIAQPVQQQKPEPPRLKDMRRQFSFFGLATAVYAFFFTVCLYKNYSGVTFPFFAGGTLYFFCLCMKKLSIPLKKDAAFYMISILLLGIATFLTDDGSIIFLNYIAVLILFISFMLHHFFEDSKWNFSGYCMALLTLVFGSIGSMGHLFADFSKYHKEKKDNKNNIIIYVFLGILAAVPMLFIILLLLTSADVVFYDMLKRVFDKLLHLDDIFGCIFWFVAIFLLSYGFVAFLCKKDNWKESKGRRTGEPILAITVTVILSVVYVIFSMIQIVYLFFRQMKLPEGFSYAAYARRGFFQLAFVCIINLIIVLVCMYRFKESRILKGVLTVISACTYIMIASSAMRMIMYVEYYYLTFLRLFVLWALAVIFLLMTGVLITVYKDRFPLFRYSMIVVTVLYIALSFSHPDYWIAKYNIDNLSGYNESNLLEQRGGYTDLYYLSTLSMDAAPILLDAEQCTEEVYQSIYANGYVLRTVKRTENMGMRNFNVSRFIAKGMLSKNR